jgi:hypothetical protein
LYDSNVTFDPALPEGSTPAAKLTVRPVNTEVDELVRASLARTLATTVVSAAE